MPVTLHPLQPGELPILERLMQLYLYDFSALLCDSSFDAIGEDGRYDPGFQLARYINKPGYSAQLARVDGGLAGFVLVSSRTNYHQGEGRMIDEFFVLRCYRQQGVGKAMAYQTFDAYRGVWEIAAINENVAAQAFWRNVLAAYTGNRYEERVNELGEVWQLFDSSQW